MGNFIAPFLCPEIEFRLRSISEAAPHLHSKVLRGKRERTREIRKVERATTGKKALILASCLSKHVFYSTDN